MNAAHALYGAESLPPETASVIHRVVLKYLDQASPLKLNDVPTYMGILSWLASLAGHIGSDEALQSVLLLARAHPLRGEGDDEQLRHAAVSTLIYFRQRAARDALREFSTDRSQLVREAATYALAHPLPLKTAD